MGQFRITSVDDKAVDLGVVGERQYDPVSGLEFTTARVDADELAEALDNARLTKAEAAKRAKEAPQPGIDPRHPSADSSPFAEDRPAPRVSSPEVPTPPPGSVGAEA